MASGTLDIDELVARLSALPRNRRYIVAVAGPPGSGKSTVSDALLHRLNANDPGRAAILPMDGYHYDNGLLTEMGLLARKGAPETFDVGGFAQMLTRLAANKEPAVAVPVFDRDIEIARAGARLIPSEADLIIAEGNYLLLGEGPWDMLAPLFDLTVMVDVKEDELRRRLEARWRGYGMSDEEISAKVDGNDLPNGLRVLRNSRPADVVLENG